MSCRNYHTELNKDSFFSKLEKYSIFRFFGTSIQGKLKNGEGLLIYGYRGTKNFSIEFSEEKQIKVNNHICFFDIFCFFAAIIMLIGVVIMFIHEGLLAGILFFLFPMFFCGLSLLINILAWNKVDKVLKKDFACTRKD